MTVSHDPSVGLGRLAGFAYSDKAEQGTLANDVLKLVADSLDVGLTFLSTIDSSSLYIEGVYDRAGMGLEEGSIVPLCDTY